MTRTNDLGQPIGRPVAWTRRERPPRAPMVGRYGRVEPVTRAHASGLFEALCGEHDRDTWTYMAIGPFGSLDELEAQLQAWLDDPGWEPYAIVDPSGRAVGLAQYLRIDEENGSIEVGSIAYGRALRRTRLATEAMFLMACRVFDDLGYRRYEWKCDDLNAPSRAAAARLGFSYEGTFRNALVYKGRNRDTAWYAMTDDDWRALRPAYERWLDPQNFDESGRQRTSLSDLTRS